MSLTTALLALGLGSATGQPQSITVIEVAKTKGDSSAPFGTVVGMVEIGPGTVILADDKHKALHRWDVGPGRVSRFARSGQGPGEVEVPVSLARRPHGGFALYDLSRGVLLFDRTLQFERRFALQGGFVSNPKNITVLGDGSVVVAGGRLRDPRHLHHYSATGDWLESFGDPPAGLTSTYSRVQTSGGALRALPTGFLFSVGTPLRIVQFPGNTFASPSNLAEDTRLLPPLTEATVTGPPEPQSKGNPTFRWWHDRSTGVFSLTDGRIVNVVTRFYRGDSIWDLYNRNGKHLARGTIPRAYYAWDLAADGNILASYRDPDTDEAIAVVLRLVLK